MIKKPILKKIALIIFAATFAVIIPINNFAHARTSAEIAEEIRQQQEQLQNTINSLNQINQNISNYESAIVSTADGLPKVEAEIKKLEAEIEKNKSELSIIEQSKRLKELQKQAQELEQHETLKSSYIEWRMNGYSDIKLLIGEDNNYLKVEEYTNKVSGDQQKRLVETTNQLYEIGLDINDYNKKLEDLNKISAELAVKKQQLEQQMAYYQLLIASGKNEVTSLESSKKTIQSNISSLSDEQRAAMIREQEILNNNPGNGLSVACTKDGPSGTFKICGNGRDLIMGHGVGMSQYGARGAALQGWSANQILEFYYQGTQVVNWGLNQEISVKYCQGNPALAPFQEGCYYSGTYYGPVVTERVAFDEYLSGLGEMPASWPEESRKAQIIAARTYAARFTNNGDPNYPICLTVYCQVSYFRNGAAHEAALVQATKDLVVTYQGSLVETLYSADNNQGHGTADADTRFQNVWGDGTYTPHLTAVNDNAIANISRLFSWPHCQSIACGLWEWQTNSYTYANIEDMLNYEGYGYLVQQLGGIGGMNFIRDGSLRVKKVQFLGLNGQTFTLGGWWFKYYWNDWTSARQGTDYIYSQTYSISFN